MSAFIHVDLTNSIGALQIGNLFSIFLFGILTHQAYIYHNTFREDRWTYKALVASVWLMEVGYTALVSFEVYRATITLFGEPQLLVKLPGLGFITTLGGGITFLVQGFFAFRLFAVLPGIYRYIGPFCIGMSWLRFFGGFFLTLEALSAPTVVEFIKQWSWLISILLAVGAAIDVLVALSTVYYLQRQRGVGVQRLANVVERLIIYTIRTGLLTSISAVFILIMFQSLPHNLIWVAMYTFLAKLYSNSLLSVLNARRGMREEFGNSGQTPSRPVRRTIDSEGRGHIRLGSLSSLIEIGNPNEKEEEESPVIHIKAKPLPRLPSPELAYHSSNVFGNISKINASDGLLVVGGHFVV